MKRGGGRRGEGEVKGLKGGGGEDGKEKGKKLGERGNGREARKINFWQDIGVDVWMVGRRRDVLWHSHRHRAGRGVWWDDNSS